MEEKGLNTMDSFRNGFKIERDGKVYTLTPEEMSDFRYLEKATTGQDCIDVYCEHYDSESYEYHLLQEMMLDEDLCFNIEDEILDIAFYDSSNLEADVIESAMRRIQGEFICQNKN